MPPPIITPIRQHAALSIYAGIALLVMAITLLAAAFTVWDALAPRADALAIRTATGLGILSAAFFFMYGVVRLSVEPLLYIDGLDHAWGESGYLTVQLMGIHGFAQAGVLAVCLWAVGVSLVGLRTKALPLALCLLGVIPAVRILGILGPLGILPDGLWILLMLSIPGVMLWCLLLGALLVRRGFATSHVGQPAGT